MSEDVISVEGFTKMLKGGLLAVDYVSFNMKVRPKPKLVKEYRV